MRRFLFLATKKCRIYAACGVSQTPITHYNEKEVTFMGKIFFDYDKGDFGFSISDNMGIDSDGNMIMRISDNMAMDMDSGDIHMISSWSADDDE